MKAFTLVAPVIVDGELGVDGEITIGHEFDLAWKVNFRDGVVIETGNGFETYLTTVYDTQPYLGLIHLEVL